MKLTVDVHHQGHITTVHCSGRITYGREAPHLSAAISGLLPSTRELILHLRDLDLVDSAGLGELVLLFLWAKASNCKRNPAYRT